MKKIFFLIIAVGLSFAQMTLAGEARWVPIEEIEEQIGKEVRDVTDRRGYWAGSVEEAEIIFYDDGSVKTTGKLKVKISWVTDRTDYECHKIYVMHEENLKDFTHRSLALRQCR